MTDENGTAGPEDGDSPSGDADSDGPTGGDGGRDRDAGTGDGAGSDTDGGTGEGPGPNEDGPPNGDGADAERDATATDAEDREDTEPDHRDGAPDLSELATELSQLREDVDDIDGRTVEKPALEAELKRYVRARMRRGRARGWGPYLVLLYGTIMTVAAFRYLDGWFAIGAMVILFLSTLGLYTLFVLVGVGLNLLSIPSRTVDAIRRRR